MTLTACGPTPKPVVVAEIPPTPLSIRTNPGIMMVKLPMRITCQLPTDLKEDGTYIFGVVDMFMDSGPIDKLQFEQLITGGCEPIRIVCGYTLTGQTKPNLIYKDMEPNGDCGRVSQH